MGVKDELLAISEPVVEQLGYRLVDVEYVKEGPRWFVRVFIDKPDGISLDDCKAVNDAFGHQAGDTVLVEAVRYVLTHLRPYDEFFRYGGEEFLLCISGMNLETGHDAVERVREGLATIAIDVGGGRTVSVTASFGVTLLDADVPVEESIARADQALYRAKDAGRNRTRLWDATMS